MYLQCQIVTNNSKNKQTNTQFKVDLSPSSEYLSIDQEFIGLNLQFLFFMVIQIVMFSCAGLCDSVVSYMQSMV